MIAQIYREWPQYQYINYGYQWLCHYTCSGFCKTSYHLLISPPPTNLPNTLNIHTGENNKIDRQVRQYTHAIFLLTVRRIWMFFSLKPSPYQGESSLKISGRWGLPFRRSQGTSKHTHKLTFSLTDWCFDREINQTFCIIYVKRFLGILNLGQIMKYILELAYKKNSSLIDIPLDQKFSFLVSHLAENYVFTYLISIITKISLMKTFLLPSII